MQAVIHWLLHRLNDSFFTSSYVYLFPREIKRNLLGTIHLRRQHVLGGKGYPHVPMVKRSQYIRIKNPLHKHFAGMPMDRGRGHKSWKFADLLNGWSLSYKYILNTLFPKVPKCNFKEYPTLSFYVLSKTLLLK